MSVEFPQTAYGKAVPITGYLMNDSSIPLLTDSGDNLLTNFDVEYRYTNPYLHRRIDEDAQAATGSNYQLVVYDKDGNPYLQYIEIGVWDRFNSYRLTETFIHDEESETCEVP